MSSYPDLNQKLEIAEQADTQEEGDKPSTSGTMSGDKPKRAGRKPGRRGSKMDVRAKLERSRQSARECRARKKMRYQYLEDLVANREKAVFALRNELEMYKQWCLQVDKGLMPLMLLQICEEESKKEKEWIEATKSDVNVVNSNQQHIQTDDNLNLEQPRTSQRLDTEETKGNDSAERRKMTHKEFLSGATGGPGDVIEFSTVNIDDILSLFEQGERTEAANDEDIVQDNEGSSSDSNNDSSSDSSCDLISLKRTKLSTIMEEPEN